MYTATHYLIRKAEHIETARRYLVASRVHRQTGRKAAAAAALARVGTYRTLAAMAHWNAASAAYLDATGGGHPCR